MDNIRVGVVQYPMSRPTSLKAWQEKLHGYLVRAKQAGVEVVLFPELIAIEGIALIDPTGNEGAEAIRTLAEKYTPTILKNFSEWAKEQDLTVITGSWPVKHSDGTVYNTSHVFSNTGELIQEQLKNHLTRGELDFYKLNGATGNARTFTLPGGITAAIAICFDSEFPNFLPALEGTIPEIIFVPSMTEDDYGRYRVSRSASARAVEYHAYVVVTATVGGSSSDPVLGAHVGQAKAFAPSDKKFPSSGLLGEGPLNQDHLFIVDLDLKTLRLSRKTSTTFPAKILHGGSSSKRKPLP